MQHQYWVTKKSVLRKLGGKEDECIVSSDAELDAKLELFKSINESCTQLQRIIDLYQERICYLVQEENALGRYLKECGKKEKNASAGQIMLTAGKAISYTGHQRLSIRPPLVRLHHEVETFRIRAITDTRVTVSEMEKARTEYRAALSWMKSASSQLDPDSGMSLERFRKAQSYVKPTKAKFDRFTLACLQKVDLLAAARCNMFSHALVSYQNAIKLFSKRAADTLFVCLEKLENVEQPDFTLLETDKDKDLFFNSEYSDEAPAKSEQPKSTLTDIEEAQSDVNLLGEDFSTTSEETPESQKIDDSKPSSALLNLDWSDIGLNSGFGGDFMPSRLMQEGSFTFNELPSSQKSEKVEKTEEIKKPNESNVSWLSLFAELDPLANPSNAVTDDNRA